MKYSFAAAAVAAFASRAVAQDLSGLPSCAQNAAIAGISATECRVSDFACICSSTAFITSVAAAIQAACSPADQSKTFIFAQSLCASAGITIAVPGATSSASASSSTSSAAAIVSATTTATYAAPLTTLATSNSAKPTYTAPAVVPVSNGTTNGTVTTALPSPTPSSGAIANGASWLLSGALAAVAVYVL